MRVTLDCELWITLGKLHAPTVTNQRGEGMPGAVTPTPTVLRAGTVLEIRRYVPGCAGCEKIEAGAPPNSPLYVEHTHGRP